jgi:hypothetical protein
MGKKTVENFHLFSNLVDHNSENFKQNPTIVPTEHFQLYNELTGSYQKSIENIFYHFLNMVYDSDEKDIKNVLPLYLTELSSVLGNRSEMTRGFNRFLKVTPDLSTDYPHLTTYLSATILTLLDINAINPEEIVWLDTNYPADEAPLVEYFYQLMGEVLKLMYQRSKSW